MFEQNHSLDNENEPVRARLPYAAVPLRPWQALYPGSDENYFNASRQHIEMVLCEAILKNYHHEDDREKIGNFLLTSLLATHANRLDYNHDSMQVLDGLEEPCEALEHACDGLATPKELVNVLESHPEIKAIELAKLSHPLDFAASADMDNAIAELLIEKDARQIDTKTRYKRKRLHEQSPLLIVTRKTEIGDLPAANGVIRVTRRQSLLVRGDVDPDDVALQRMVQNDQRFDELTQRIEDYFPLSSFSANNPSDQFVQPVTTSYYAKFLDAEVCAKLGIEQF